MDRREIVVGKDADADLVIPDTGVSRRHLKLVCASDDIYNLIDLDSTNGVQVNGVGVDLTVLREHDFIVLGPRTQLLFTYDPNSVAQRPVEPDVPLTERQIEVARHVCRGLSNPAIAEQLGISPRTVTSHLDHIYTRLGIGSRAELVRYLTKKGLE